MIPTKRNLSVRLEELEQGLIDQDGRLELLDGPGIEYRSEPDLTDDLVSAGFVVEREERVHNNGNEDVVLYTTPSAFEVFYAVLWHYPGPTAPRDDVCIAWEDDRLEQVLDSAEYPIAYTPPDCPANASIVVEGDGWRAIAPTERVIENMVLRRSSAESYGYKIIGPVGVPIENSREYDFVEVDADPVPYVDRRPANFKA